VHFGYSLNITTFIVRLLVKAIVPILYTAFQPTKSKTFELCDYFFVTTCGVYCSFSSGNVLFSISFVIRMNTTLNAMLQSVFYNMFRPLVSAKIRQTHINIIGKV